jgi:hypothetical protein
MYHSISTINVFSVFLAMRISAIVGTSSNFATISCFKCQEGLIKNALAFSVKRRHPTYDKWMSQQQQQQRTFDKRGMVHEKNRQMAFIGLTSQPHHLQNVRTHSSILVHPDPIDTMMMMDVGRKNQLPRVSSPSLVTEKCTRLYHSSPQRDFFNRNNNPKDDEEPGILGQAKKLAKKFLPSTWFQSEEERRQIVEQKQRQKEIQTGIQQIFKDAPLPIRMVSNMIGPIFGTMMSSLAETAASQQSLIDIVYDQGVQAIRTDPVVQGILGDSITVGRPFSQSSSSSSINGVTSTRIELAFPVSGRLGNGVGRLSASGGANNPIIDRLVVQANGREVDVRVGASSFNQRLKSDIPNVMDKSNIIDAEIIEKETKK